MDAANPHEHPPSSLKAVPVAPVTALRPSPASLHLSPIETSEQSGSFDVPRSLPKAEGFQKFIHSGWSAIRSKVYDGLVRTGQTAARCKAFCECGGSARLQFEGPTAAEATNWRVVGSRCHDRLCTPCAVARSWDIRLALYDQLQGKAHKFITLTLRTGPEEPLHAAIKRLYAGFRALRRMPLWEEKVRGGAAFLEITRGQQRNKNTRAVLGGSTPAGETPIPQVPHWHAHLHIIADADYIVQKELSYAWKNATRDSYIVDIQRAAGDSAANYVTKYVTKALSGSFLTDAAVMDEFIMAIKGTRFITTFGDWYGKQSLAALEADPLYDSELGKSGWTTYTDLSHAAAAALAGDPVFLAALNATPFGRWLRTQGPAP